MSSAVTIFLPNATAGHFSESCSYRCSYGQGHELRVGRQILGAPSGHDGDGGGVRHGAGVGGPVAGFHAGDYPTSARRADPDIQTGASSAADGSATGAAFGTRRPAGLLTATWDEFTESVRSELEDKK